MDLTKTITIDEPHAQVKLKSVTTQKEKKLRIETTTWGLTEEELGKTLQYEILQFINESIVTNTTLIKTSYISMIISHIKAKISSYRQQDILKKKLLIDTFISFNEVIKLLIDCELLCHYCSCNVYILYPQVREKTQWSLDRINNNIGHDTNNLVIACLDCNLKRRRTNKDAFMFSKNLKIIKQS